MNKKREKNQRKLSLVESLSSRSLQPRSSCLLRRRCSASAKQSAHHIHQRIALSRLLNAKVHLSNHLQGLRPRLRLVYLRRILGNQALVDFGSASLDGQEQQAQEVEQRQAGEDSNVGSVAGDILNAEGWVVVCECADEESVGCGSGADVADEEIG